MPSLIRLFGRRAVPSEYGAAYLEHNLAVLCGAEAATVVNNCAAALVLTLRHFATPQRPDGRQRGDANLVRGQPTVTMGRGTWLPATCFAVAVRPLDSRHHSRR